MNERIEKLAEQAGWGQGQTYDDCMQCSPFDPEKFAELIIKDCMEINKQELSFTAFERLINKYQDHFGVEA
jgi:hypothetical protein